MANDISTYVAEWWANEALEVLFENLGVARVINRVYEDRPSNAGDVIHVNIPSSFEVQDVPAGSAIKYQDLNTGGVDIRLDQNKHVSFLVSDRDLTLGQSRLVSDHITPAMRTLARGIDASILGLGVDVPWAADHNAGSVQMDFTNARERLNRNNAPEEDRWFFISPGLESAYLNSTLFAQANTDASGGLAQRDAFLGRRYGLNTFMTQLIPSSDLDTMGTDRAGTTVGAQSAGTTSMTVGNLGTGSISKGQIFTVAGSKRSYVVSADAAISSNSAEITFAPALDADAVGGAEVTFVQHDNDTRSLALHRDAFGLVMVPISDAGAGLGVNMATVSDAATGLNIRATTGYDMDLKSYKVSFDVLYGLTTLRPDLAFRVESED